MIHPALRFRHARIALAFLTPKPPRRFRHDNR